MYQVMYEAGSQGSPLAAELMNALDCELVPLLHAGALPPHLLLELVFHILDHWAFHLLFIIQISQGHLEHLRWNERRFIHFMQNLQPQLVQMTKKLLDGTTTYKCSWAWNLVFNLCNQLIYSFPDEEYVMRHDTTMRHYIINIFVWTYDKLYFVYSKICDLIQVEIGLGMQWIRKTIIMSNILLSCKFSYNINSAARAMFLIYKLHYLTLWWSESKSLIIVK